jgi:hypothetical protein
MDEIARPIDAMMSHSHERLPLEISIKTFFINTRSEVGQRT